MNLPGRNCAASPWQTLTWQSPEGIPIKPLYTLDDLENLQHLDTMPGLAPFVRGPRATMYANRPWTIRQYAGFSTAEESNRFLSGQPSGGAKGSFGGLRPGNPPGL